MLKQINILAKILLFSSLIILQCPYSNTIEMVANTYAIASNVVNGDISIDQAKNFIEKLLEDINSDENIPREMVISLEEWKNAKKICALWVAIKNFNDLELAPYCLKNIIKIICGGVSRNKVNNKNFKLARYLLMSQCCAWDETKNKFTLQKKYNRSIVGEAIGKICSAENKKQAKTLLNSLIASKKFSPFLQYNNYNH
jgi:hypothetical protein